MNYLIKKAPIKGTIVCIHGNSSSPKIFQSLLDSKKNKHTIIAFELPGHSKKDSNYTIDDFASKSMCKSLINSINEIEDDIFLIGNSLGGHLAIEIANHINNLKGLMIFGTPPVKKPINFEEAFNVVPALNTFLTENPTETEIIEAAKVAVHNIKDVATIVKDFKTVNPLVRKSLGIDLVNNNWNDQRNIFLNLNIPKYIIAGNEDPTINKNYIEEIASIDPNCDLQYISNCGHYPTLEQSDAFMTVLNKASKKVFSI